MKGRELVDTTMDQVRRMIVESLTLEERVAGLTSEERLRGIPPEERLRDVSPRFSFGAARGEVASTRGTAEVERRQMRERLRPAVRRASASTGNRARRSVMSSAGLCAE